VEWSDCDAGADCAAEGSWTKSWSVNSLKAWRTTETALGNNTDGSVMFIGNDQARKQLLDVPLLHWYSDCVVDVSAVLGGAVVIHIHVSFLLT
jgi:hypothetical protein